MDGMILLTGATGFLGSRIARLLLENSDHRLTVLVRGKDGADAHRRFERAWSNWWKNDGVDVSRVQVVRGDLSLPRLGIDHAVYSGLVNNLTHIIHAAAELQLDGNLDELRRINVGGTASLLELARHAHEDHGLERFAHVSTAYVAGRRTGEVAEEDLLDGSGFFNAYEQTKFEGECLVRQAMPDLPVSVFRPGMVVGDSLTGEIQSFNTVYVPLRLYLTGRLKLIPARPEMPLNIVPVDYVAGAIARLTLDERAIGLTFHLTVAQQNLPRTREFLESARNWAVERLGNAPAPARFVPLQVPVGSSTVTNRMGVPASLLSYFSERRIYRRDNVDRLLGPYTPDWQAIMPRLLDYAVSRGFLGHANRTVHEQLMHRLQSKRIPIRIHDIVEGVGTRLRTGTEMCREINDAADALRAAGIAPGDRVALVGLNSSRYLSLDTAIGLTGAVSVPLYYTSPVNEIDEILRESGARLLLIGAPAILVHVNEIRSPVTIASFCSSPLPPGIAERVIPWESFLQMGVKTPENKAADPGPAIRTVSTVARSRFIPEAPVTFSDLATLRFTSGTTGAPKGVAFRHGQMLWLAETITSLLPWEVKTTPVRYLSFLPMNHVVEGILGTYAPSYIPAPVDIYFLDNFHALAKALPQVRPTVFFSVPRFYDKVWNRFTQSPAGRLYRSLPANGPRGALRKTLRPILRISLLRRVGLDKCAQLIAGSAPCPEGLLESFRELGIEIHNAYGLTEAPLVTLNRHGANRLGTVGMPLPNTQVRIATDGEVLVRGPQVTTGYFGGSANDIVRDGWLYTGDLGEIDSGGSLIICGRKKEILITSYGKNIHPVKIEGMLRRIPGMVEAMIIGDNRPALSALLWPEKGFVTPAAIDEIDRCVLQVNNGLSHPEQVKRWAILAENPAIDSGELTGNLKLRRQVVLARRAKVVEMLYDGRRRAAFVGMEPEAPGVLHIGESQCA